MSGLLPLDLDIRTVVLHARPCVCRNLAETGEGGHLSCVRVDLKLRSRAPLRHGSDGRYDVVALLPASPDIVAVHRRNHFQRNFLWACGGALADIRAATEALRVHLRDHVDGAMVTFDRSLWKDAEMRNLCAGKERSRGIRTCSHARSAANARS